MSGVRTRARCGAALLAAAAVLVLGGCRADDHAAAPAGSPSVPLTRSGPTGAAVDDPGVDSGVVDAGVPPAGPDPLADVDALVGAVERDLDADAGVAGR